MGQTSAQAWMEQGEKRGRKEGEKRGELKAKQDVLLKLMQTKFGVVSPALTRKVKAIRNTRRLDDLLKKGFTTNTLGEIGIE